MERAACRERSGPLPTSRKNEWCKKTKNGQRRRSEIEATLQQGLQLRAERSAAGQFWTFTMSNSKTFSRLRFTHVQRACMKNLKACDHCHRRGRSFARTAARAS